TSAASCSPGSEYRPVSGTLAFGAGQTSRTFAVPICPDQLMAGPKTVGLTLSAPSAGALLGPPATATLQIADQDLGGVLRWSQAAVAVSEGAGSVTLTVSRTGGSAGGVSVDYVIAGGTATAPPGADADFAGPLTGTLTFAPGQTSRTLT